MSENPVARRYQEKARKWARRRLQDEGWWPDNVDLEDPRDNPHSPAFEPELDVDEPRIDTLWDEEAENRIARGSEA